MIILSIISLSIAIVCYGISQLQQHGQLRWMKDAKGFWGDFGYYLKYKIPLTPAPNNFYYKYIARVEYKERWFTSTNLTTFLTDGYHFAQFWMFNFLSLSIVLAIGFNWWLFLGVLFGTRVVHWSARQILSK